MAHLDVYQRTAPYVVPRNDRRYSRRRAAALQARSRRVQRAYRAATYSARELYVPGFVWNPKLTAPAKRMALANIAKGIDDPELRAKVTPDYEIGCKRILISNTYYPALAADHVDLVTDPIVKVTGDAVVTADGVERPIDVLVVATGFQTTEQPIAEHIHGRDGRIAGRGVGRARAWRPTRAPRRAASPTSSSSSAPTPVWGTPRWCS